MGIQKLWLSLILTDSNSNSSSYAHIMPSSQRDINISICSRQKTRNVILYPKEYFPTKVSQYEIWSYTYCENEWNGMESNFIEVYFCIVDCCWNYSTGKRMPEFRHQSKHKTQHMRFHEPCQIYLTNLLKQTWKKSWSRNSWNKQMKPAVASDAANAVIENVENIHIAH